MRNWIVCAALGLVALGLTALTPAAADAHPPRVFVGLGYYPPVYTATYSTWAPSPYAAAPVYGYGYGAYAVSPYAVAPAPVVSTPVAPYAVAPAPVVTTSPYGIYPVAPPIYSPGIYVAPRVYYRRW